MITKVPHLTLFVANQDNALKFYTESLGFKVHTTVFFLLFFVSNFLCCMEQSKETKLKKEFFKKTCCLAYPSSELQKEFDDALKACNMQGRGIMFFETTNDTTEEVFTLAGSYKSIYMPESDQGPALFVIRNPSKCKNQNKYVERFSIYHELGHIANEDHLILDEQKKQIIKDAANIFTNNFFPVKKWGKNFIKNFSIVLGIKHFNVLKKCNHSLELAADKFACKHLLKQNKRLTVVSTAVWFYLQRGEETLSHPSCIDRGELMLKNCI